MQPLPRGAQAVTCMHPASPPWPPPSEPPFTQTADQGLLYEVIPLLGIRVRGEARDPPAWDKALEHPLRQKQAPPPHARGCVQGFPSPVSQTARQAVVCHSRAAGSERRTRLAGEVCLSGESLNPSGTPGLQGDSSFQGAARLALAGGFATFFQSQEQEQIQGPKCHLKAFVGGVTIGFPEPRRGGKGPSLMPLSPVPCSTQNTKEPSGWPGQPPVP